MMKRRTFIKNTGISTAAFSMMPFTVNSMISGKQPGNKAEGNFFQPVDNKKALVNPDMGWIMYYYSHAIKSYGSRLEPSDTVDDFPGLSTVYLRSPWAFLELEEGKFNWELFDTPAQRWIEKGKRVALRVTAEESYMKFATPEWVKNAGAEGFDAKWGDSAVWEPKFDDPVFLDKMDNFVAAMAKRYDGKSYIDFVDIGHYGMWGEGHTVSITKKRYPFEVKKKYIDIYLKHFKNTLLCINDDFCGSNESGIKSPIIDYARSKGLTFRDDSIMVLPKPRPWFHAEMAQQFWPEVPVVLEHQHYGPSVKKGAWSEELFLKSVEDYHASYMSIHWWPRILLEKNRNAIDKINLRMGYRIQLNEISWPEIVHVGETFSIKSKWSNVGVAPVYGGGFPCLTIKDKKGGIVAVLVDEQFDFRDLPVAKTGSSQSKEIISNFTIGSQFHDPARTFARVVQTGSFEVFFSVGNPDGTPVYELPYNNVDGFKRYKIGNIRVEI